VPNLWLIRNCVLDNNYALRIVSEVQDKITHHLLQDVLAIGSEAVLEWHASLYAVYSALVYKGGRVL
jgi:hypothetical protein